MVQLVYLNSFEEKAYAMNFVSITADSGKISDCIYNIKDNIVLCSRKCIFKGLTYISLNKLHVKSNVVCRVDDIHWFLLQLTPNKYSDEIYIRFKRMYLSHSKLTNYTL